MQTQEVHQVVGSASWHDAEDDDRIGLLDVEHQRGIQSVGGYEIRQYRVMKVSVVIPTALNDKQKKLLRELGETFTGDVTPRENKGFFEKVKDAFAGKD